MTHNPSPITHMTHTKFRLAIVGAGLITRGTHLPTALSLPEMEVSALVDPVVSRAAELAAEYGVKPLLEAQVGEVIGNVDGAHGMDTPFWHISRHLYG